MSGDFPDVFDDIFTQRIDLHAAGAYIFGDDFDRRRGVLRLIEDAPYLFPACLLDQPRQVTGRRLLSVVFDGELFQSVVRRIVGEGGVVDDEVFDAYR